LCSHTEKFSSKQFVTILTFISPFIFQGNLIEGLNHHKFYFDFAPSASSHETGTVESIAENPVIRVMGRSAIISYIRATKTIESEISSTSTRHQETRIWQLFDSRWRQVHVHRGLAPEPVAQGPVVANTMATA
jgi:Calcium/calmodulin dependent protein kinase II association domain